MTTVRDRVRRTQAQRRDESERLLVEAMLEIVSAQGVSAATFEEIGRKAGVSRGLATQHFGSKRGLIAAVIAHLHRKREEALQSVMTERTTPFQGVILYIKSHLLAQEREQDGRAYFMLLASTVADATMHRELFATSHHRVREHLHRLLEAAQKAGEISESVDCDATALTIGSLLLGASMQKLVDPNTTLEPVAKAATTILNNTVSPQRKRIIPDNS